LLKSTHKYSAVNQLNYNLPKIVSFDILLSLQPLSVAVNLFIMFIRIRTTKIWESPLYEIFLNLFKLLIVTTFVQKSDDVSNYTWIVFQKTPLFSFFNPNSGICLLLLPNSSLHL